MPDLEWKNLLKSAFGSLVINLIINGVIAWLMFRSHTSIPWAEMWPDILITVFVISLIVGVTTIAISRQALRSGEMAPGDWQWRDHTLLGRLPENSLGRSVLFASVLTMVFGGLVVGSLGMLGVREMANWGYIGFKALYAGVAAAVTTLIMSICTPGDDRDVASSSRSLDR